MTSTGGRAAAGGEATRRPGARGRGEGRQLAHVAHVELLPARSPLALSQPRSKPGRHASRHPKLPSPPPPATAPSCLEVQEAVWAETFKYMADNKVLFEGILLKPAMVTPGADCKKRASPETVAAYTLKMLRRRVPPAVPGIMFLSGGQVGGPRFGTSLCPSRGWGQPPPAHRSTMPCAARCRRGVA